MKINSVNILRTALLGLVAASAISCVSDMIFEEELCPEPVPVPLIPAKVLVTLKYDYNIQRADMRKDHVGWARVAALDENDVVVEEKIVSNSDTLRPLAQNDFAVEFETLVPGNRYHFMATAFQRDYDKISAEDGAKFRVKFPVKGESVTSFKTVLDRDSVAGESGFHNVPNSAGGLDTLWIGHSIVEGGLLIPEPGLGVENIVRDTISLVRDTKYIHLTLHNLDDERANIYDSTFVVRIIGSNGVLAWDNEVLEDDVLEYSPFAAWTTALSENGHVYDDESETATAPEDDPIVERAAHFDISCSRLIYYAQLDNNAELQIINRSNGKEIVRINLPFYLSFGRDAYSTRNYSRQEYLDREYDYHLDFFLKDGIWWEYMNLSVNILPWAVRFQHIEF